ncbi:LysR family transcriptional regulator [Acetobacterium paludosum]|uniref:LysR family transcriptional regulator n=1 Tax=Acetobacterium paludosum TaxID=52693 RepID=A0A923KQQ6_9FIRM|nr:LysR family transcriptional regulator [Acetobacterium paludosum]MBC3889384.1 LysR family transcriptional regulator [Acetobacterium paludosum]
MDIKQLKYFLAIAEEGQITAAAKKLNMAQPPLSHQLKLLEEELGVKLFERGPRHVQLTDSGKILMNRAHQILELTNSVVKEVKDLSNGLQGTLSIGTVSSSGATLLNERMSEFHKQYDNIKFEIFEGNTFTLIDLLNKGIIEVGIVRTPFNALNFECKYAKTEPMIVAIPKEMNWKSNNMTLSIRELKNKPLIIYRRFEQLICDTCMEHGFAPEIFCKCDDARTALLWANAGTGIAIIPKSAFELAANSNLVIKEIKSEKLKTKIAAIWVKDRYISPLAANFIKSFGIV